MTANMVYAASHIVQLTPVHVRAVLQSANQKQNCKHNCTQAAENLSATRYLAAH